MSKKTVGLVFVKSRTGQASETEMSLSQLMAEFESDSERDIVIDSVISTMGAYDFVVVVHAGHAERISDFVLTELRENRRSLIADTNTFVGWLIGKRLEGFSN